MGLKRITARQLEFLKDILEHYTADHDPIHYTAVAKWLGVSKWTAYDMLKRLGEGGYLRSCYRVNQGIPGRSLILYAPTTQSLHLLDREKEGEQEDWASWRKQLSRCVAKLRQEPGEGRPMPIEELTVLLSESETPLQHCACLVALFIAYLKTFNEKGMVVMHRAVGLVKGSEQRLALLSGTILGSLAVESAPEKMGEQGVMTELVDRFHQQLSSIGLKQYRLLSALMVDLLSMAG